MTRALLQDAAQARRAIIVGCTQASMELTRASALHIELGISVAGFFDDRGSDRLGCSKHAQLLGRFGDVAAFVNTRNIDVIFIAIAPGQVARVRELMHELGDTTASIYFVPDVIGFRRDPAAHQRDPRHAGGGDVRDAVPRLPRARQAPHGRHRSRASRWSCSSPLLLGIAWAVKRSSPGPVLFRQRRYGLDGREIHGLQIPHHDGVRRRCDA